MCQIFCRQKLKNPLYDYFRQTSYEHFAEYGDSLEFLKTFRPRNVIISNLLNLQATAPTSGREHCILNYKQLKLLSLTEVGESDFNFSTFEIITFGRSFQEFQFFQFFRFFIPFFGWDLYVSIVTCFCYYV